MVVIVALVVVFAASLAVIAAPAGFRRWQDRFPLNPWHLTATATVLAAVLAAIYAARTVPPGPLVLVALVIVVLFARAWVREWHFLMDLTDDHLPGRYDKPIWAALLVAVPPVGACLFRAYRLRRWPEVAAKPRIVAEIV